MACMLRSLVCLSNEGCILEATVIVMDLFFVFGLCVSTFKKKKKVSIKCYDAVFVIWFRFNLTTDE